MRTEAWIDTNRSFLAALLASGAMLERTPWKRKRRKGKQAPSYFVKMRLVRT